MTEFSYLQMHKFKDDYYYIFVDLEDKSRKLIYMNDGDRSLLVITRTPLIKIVEMFGPEIGTVYSVLPMVIFGLSRLREDLKAERIEYEFGVLSLEEILSLIRSKFTENGDYVFRFSEN